VPSRTAQRIVALSAAASRRGALAVLSALAAFALAASPASAVPFGRNKVQYDTFDWHVLRTPHLEIHFYPEEEALARRAAVYGEDACAALEKDLGHELTARIPVIVYESHYHFRQNNVMPDRVDESTGGFTEIFRDRVVLPYSGSEPGFRHVIHHELVHAFVFDRLFGNSLASLFLRQYAFYMPLWFMEGIAEYYSTEWDSEGEMMLRDAAVQGGLPPFPQINGGYFVYKAGASAIGFLVARHGDDVIRRILDDITTTRDIRVSIHNVTGETLEELGQEWLLATRKRTWPTLAELDMADDYGRVLGGKRDSGGMDSHPVLSPDGDRVVFLSTRSGTPDLWLADLADSLASPRVLVHGGRGESFESLHPLHSSVGWSPDGRLIVAAAQKGPRDALYVLSTDSGHVLAELTPDVDALERPDWAPDNARFVFTGMRGGQVDLWTLDADGTGLTQLTDDLHEERGPRWSPDGRRVLFTSDRLDSMGLDLFTVDVASGDVTPVVVEPGNQWDGCWGRDGRTVVYATDEWGTRDLVRQDLVTGERHRLTKLLGGADSPSIARRGGQLAFTAYERGSFHVVLVDDPDTLSTVEAAPVPICRGFWPAEPAAAADSGAVAAAPDSAAAPADVTPTEHDYDPRLRPEWLSGSFGYGGYGASLGLSTTITDVLGDHRITAGASVFRDLANTDAYASYTYLKHRLDWGVSAFHFRDYLWDDRTTLGQPIGEEGNDALFSERQWGGAVSVSYPFHTFRRVDLDLTAMTIERTRYELIDDRYRESSVTRGTVLRPRLSHTFDNTLWGWTGPVQGRRSVALVQQALPLDAQGVEFGSALLDVRRYARVSGEYVVAFRAMASSSWGPDPQQYQLGGPNSVRGQPRQSIRGRNAALVSLEYRYPFLDYVRFGWPLRTAFGGVRGNLFLDVGTAFDDPAAARLTGPNEDGHRALRDLHIGFGVGARARIAFFPIRVDCGWPTDGAGVGKPVWDFALGPEF
jgi:Tol biopolymer transport system component